MEVLELAKELKLLKPGTVSLDGPLLRANASKPHNGTYQRAKQLRQDVDALPARTQSHTVSGIIRFPAGTWAG